MMYNAHNTSRTIEIKLAEIGYIQLAQHSYLIKRSTSKKCETATPSLTHKSHILGQYGLIKKLK